MNLIDWLSLILPVLAFACVLLILIVNIYTKIWPKRFVHVNCWFCNEWSKVLTEYENSWDCVFCEQYNGFTNDGDYNKPIQAQYDEKMNKVIKSSLKLNTTPIEINNGLCNVCNNNQRLKVHQLAMFCPINENKFEEEVEQFEKQLEHVYKLCQHCQGVVKQTLQKQKSILLSQRLKTIRQQGLDYLNLNKSHQGISKTVKKNLFLTAIRYATIALAFIRIFEVLKTCDFNDKKVGIATLLPEFLTQYISLVKDLLLICSNSFYAIAQNIWDLHEILFQNYLNTVFELVKMVINFINTIVPHAYILYLLNLKRSFIQIFIGTFLQIVYCIFDTRRRVLDFTKCIIWGFLLYNCTGQLELLTRNQSMRNIIEIAVCSFLIFFPSSLSTKSQSPQKTVVEKPSNISANNSKDLEYSDDEQLVKSSEMVKEHPEELNDSFVSTSTSIFQNSSPTMKLFSMANHATEKFDSINLFPTFGQHPVFDNPLNSAPSLFKCSEKYRSNLSSHENETENLTKNHQSFYSDQFSLNDTFSSTSTLLNSEVIKPNEMELNSGLSNLHLSAFINDKPLNNCEPPSTFHINSMALRPKPVLSPPRLRNVTQSSWVAGGYWKSNEYLNSFSGLTNLSRSSSQSSGFGSQSSSQPHTNYYEGNNVFNSLPSSKTNSVCGDFDKFSVLSEPAYQYNSNSNHNNRFYPVLKPDNQLYITPPCNNKYTNSRMTKMPVQNTSNTSLNDSFSTCFAYPITNRPSSRESPNLNSSHSTLNSYSPFSTCNNFSARSSGNPFYSHTVSRMSTPRPFLNSNRLSKGSLLQKWRENLNTETHLK